MASLPFLTILQQSDVSPPPAIVGHRSLPLTFIDITWLRLPFNPVHHLFFYHLPIITKTHFTQTLVPNLKQSLSITLQHFFPFAGKLIVFPTPTRKPEIRYLDGDSVAITIAECTLDFNDLIGNHPRDCGKFYHLIPQLPEASKVPDHVAIPVFAVQVTLFPDRGIAIGMTNHHCLGDATTRFCFLKAWTSIARSGSDESFLSYGTLPFFDRVVNYPKFDESYLKNAKVEAFCEGYQPQSLLGTTDKVRVSFILIRTVINRLKKWVSTELPTLGYVSSFTVACGYFWSCIAKLRNDEFQLFGFTIDCRARMDPPMPAAYFGNCVVPCIAMEKTALLATGKEGFLRATKLLGENLHKILTDKDGVVKDIGPVYINSAVSKKKDIGPLDELLSQGMPTTMIGVAGTPRLKFYDLDFGWGKPEKHEMISIDYNDSISLSACKESSEDLEIGVSLSATEMEAFDNLFRDGLEAYL